MTTPSTKKRKRGSESKQKPKQFLKDKFPEVCNQLKPELYPGVDLDRITCSSHQIFKWTCTEHKTCQEHVWHRKVGLHIRDGGTCPFCQTIKKVWGVTRQYCECSVPPGHVGPKVRFRQESQHKSNLLKDVHPNLYSELKPELNPGLNLIGTSINDKKQLTWKCSTHVGCVEHTWRNSTWERSKNGAGCPFCSGKSSCVCSKKAYQTETSTFKRCGRCNQSLELKHFPSGESSKTTKEICNSCQQHMDRDNKIRSAIMRILLENQKCMDCGESDSTVLHHDRNRTNKYSKGTKGTKVKKLFATRSGTFPSIVKESAQCQIVCACCHQVRMKNRRKPRIDQTPFILHNIELVKQRKLTDGKCQSCDRKVTEDNLIMFEFDHLDRTTKHKSVSYLVKGGTKLLELELQKCQVLCSNCHMRKTASELQFQKLNDFSPEIIKKAREIVATSRAELLKETKPDPPVISSSP